MTYNDTNEAILISTTTDMYYIPKIIDIENFWSGLQNLTVTDRLRDEGHKDYYLNVTETLHHWKLIFIICYMAFIILTVVVCIGLR